MVVYRGAVHELREQLCHPDEKPHTLSWLFEADSRGCGTTEGDGQHADCDVSGGCDSDQAGR